MEGGAVNDSMEELFKLKGCNMERVKDLTWSAGLDQAG